MKAIPETVSAETMLLGTLLLLCESADLYEGMQDIRAAQAMKEAPGAITEKAALTVREEVSFTENEVGRAIQTETI